MNGYFPVRFCFSGKINYEIPPYFFYVCLMAHFTINSCTTTSKSGKT